MWHKTIAWFLANKKLMILTAEVFWIFVFLLDRAMSANSLEIPQFIYVNF